MPASIFVMSFPIFIISKFFIFASTFMGADLLLYSLRPLILLKHYFMLNRLYHMVDPVEFGFVDGLDLTELDILGLQAGLVVPLVIQFFVQRLQWDWQFRKFISAFFGLPLYFVILSCGLAKVVEPV